MKDCNKKIYDKIREYLDTCLTSSVEIVIEYKDEPGRNLHQVVQYNRTGSGTWLGVVGNMFDFDFFDCKEVVSFVPFCNLTPSENTVVTIDDDDEDFLEPINTDHLRKIDVNDVKEGDYICIDGESSFCHTSYLKIVNVEPQVIWEAAKPEDKRLVNIVNYFLLCDEDWDTWSTLDGSCISNDDTMYSIVGYYRYDENYSREKERENTIGTTTDSEEELKSTEDFFNQGWVKKLCEKIVIK
jgi:hypothetical protein